MSNAPLNSRSLRVTTAPGQGPSSASGGNQMQPEIAPGSPLVYQPADRVTSSGLYLLDVDGRRHVMRVQRCGGGALLALPESDEHDSEMFKPAPGGTEDTYRSEKSGLECEIRVVGRVAGYGKFA